MVVEEGNSVVVVCGWLADAVKVEDVNLTVLVLVVVSVYQERISRAEARE